MQTAWRIDNTLQLHSYVHTWTHDKNIKSLTKTKNTHLNLITPLK